MPTPKKIDKRTRHAMATTYADIAWLIDAVCHDYVARYGGDYAEVRANADTTFIRAYQYHMANPARPFAVELRYWIWMEEFDRMRTARQYRVRPEGRCNITGGLDLDTLPRAGNGFSLTDFLDGLSADAHVLVALVLDTPEALAATARAKGGSERNMCSSLRQYLYGAGWSAVRVRAAWEEVAGALV